MLKNFDEIIQKASKLGSKRLVVAAAQDLPVLKAIKIAYDHGLIKPILIGDKILIETIAKENSIDVSDFEVIDEKNPKVCCEKAALLISQGKAELLMKGLVPTANILKAVLNKEIQLCKSNLLCHVGVLKVDSFDRLFIISDSAMVIDPTLDQKIGLINSTVKVAKSLGITEPKVAIVCAVEKVNPKMPCTLDAQKLVELNINNKIKNCIVGGPFALDIAVSEKAAEHKGVTHPVAGKADILIAPDLEAGNILNKSMEYFANAEKAGIIMGAECPIVLTSRASSDISKLNSIALAVLSSTNENDKEKNNG